MSDNTTPTADVDVISSDDFDRLFDGVTTKTPTADNIIGSNAPKEKEDAIIPIESEMESQDLEEIFKKDKKAITAEVPEEEEDKTKDEDEEESDIPEEEEEEKEEDDDEEDDDEEDEDEEEDTNPRTISKALKSTIDFYIQKGLWVDFEGREDLKDVDDEMFAHIAEQQETLRFQQHYSEQMEKAGPYGKAILKFISEGGDPEQILELFKEKQEAFNIDIEQTAGQKNVIKNYYSKIGWSDEKITSKLKQWEIEGTLGTEAKDAKEYLDGFYEQELNEIEQANKKYIEQQEAQENAFKQNINRAVTARQDLTYQQKQILVDRLVTYDQKLPNGKVVNKFFIDFMNIQANPEKYVKLAEFVMDMERYEEKAAVKKNNVKVEEKFKFISRSNKRSVSGYPKTEKTKNSKEKFTFI